MQLQSEMEDGKAEKVSFASLQEQALKDVRLLSSFANEATVVFSPQFSLFPPKFFSADDGRAAPRTSAPTLEEVQQRCRDARQLAAETNMTAGPASLREDSLQDFESSNEELGQQLETFLAAVHMFDGLYAKELRQWIRTIQPPRMQGLGPAASQALATVTSLEQLLHNLDRMRAAQLGMLGRTSKTGTDAESFEMRRETVQQEMARLSQLAAECEAEIADLERSRQVLVDSLPKQPL